MNFKVSPNSIAAMWNPSSTHQTLMDVTHSNWITMLSSHKFQTLMVSFSNMPSQDSSFKELSFAQSALVKHSIDPGLFDSK